MKRTSKPRTRVYRSTAEEVHGDSRTKRERTRGAEEAARLQEEMDEILEEIDDVLVENAEEFVSEFKQKNGE